MQTIRSDKACFMTVFPSLYFVLPCLLDNSSGFYLWKPEFPEETEQAVRVWGGSSRAGYHDRVGGVYDPLACNVQAEPNIALPWVLTAGLIWRGGEKAPDQRQEPVCTSQP